MNSNGLIDHRFFGKVALGLSFINVKNWIEAFGKETKVFENPTWAEISFAQDLVRIH